MATYSTEQAETLRRIKQLLEDVGLSTNDLVEDIPSFNPPSEEPVAINRSPGITRFLSPEEIGRDEGQITRKKKSNVHAIAEHPKDAIVEFPESGSSTGLAVAHIFPIDPKGWVHPKDNFQYSLGDRHGQSENIQCHLLGRYAKTNAPVLCKKLRRSCRSIKCCTFTNINHPKPIATMPNASREVFTKTLGFYTALRERGCRLNLSPNTESDSEGEEDEEKNEELIWLLTNSRSSNSTQTRCNGKFILEFEKNNRPWIRCEHYQQGRRGHLVLRNLIEFDIDYLKALMNNDWSSIRTHELVAFANGYGPLAPCNLTSAYREQKELCPTWHRNSSGKLQRGKFVKMNECPARFDIYEPNNLTKCPYILIVCRHPHSHPNPPRTHTPASIRVVFNKLLHQLEWRLTDATPRRLLLDSGFMSDLRRELNWHIIHDPTLTDLHPSFANHDHTGRLINTLRSELYPMGTGFDGAKYLIGEHPEKQVYETYIRHIKEHTIPGGETIYIVICMFPAMSYLFHQTNRPSIDTSFKRLHSWQEFEIEAWFDEFARSLVVARAFITSQSAEAHLILFRELFKVVMQDTGRAVHFRHIHGDGFDTITADGHRGQALGLGLYLQEICKDEQRKSSEWDKPLNALTPTEHLACTYRYCFAHYVRNISGLRNAVSSQVRAAMMSLASAEPLPDYQKVLQRIRSGGEKAAKWLKDKEASNGMTLAGIYRPASKIPIEIWRAAPTTSNGNEQAHRSINRDGTQLTMLAGIMRGFQYDSRAIQSYYILKQEGVHVRDQDSSSFRRAGKAIGKKERDQRKMVELKDTQIAQANQTIISLQQTVQTNAQGAKHALELKSPQKIKTAVKRLRNANDALQKNQDKLDKLILQGSGCIIPSGILPAQELFDHKLLDMPTEPEPTNANSTSNPASPVSPPCSHIINPPALALNTCPPSSHISQPQPSSISPPSVHQNLPKNRFSNPHPSLLQNPRNLAVNPHPSAPQYPQNRAANPYPLVPQYLPSLLPNNTQSRPSNPYPLPPLSQSLQPPSYQFGANRHPKH